MTTIVLASNIPSNINTLERLIAHQLMALKATIGNTTFNLDSTEKGGRTPYITLNTGEATEGDGQLYLQAFVYLPLDTQIRNNALNQRPWMYAKEISNNNYPAGYNLT
ncbi:hypothetical protein IQ224_18715 [Microcystis sp. LEGE 00066]|uniref:Similarity n=1 Tax=Microcystis aeruginosa (strain PCC 7806) TaxID=267872 RepID=A8YEC2_MICA7|nr:MULTISPECIES: hypothetical protein [Microcystis]TRT95746.1 MAG: hypothetical protein EWV61_21770 [Microcystis aeruginosa Ma_AC_P_19900807_S300]MBE9264088.1 hypothetical protein [Microcystis sp. LEGE 00066]UGS09158.1 hypothetical protein LRR78_24315 [Microcystis aeruginosa FACHB-905 = DIANCHI905]UGS10933.1 hypothetical protein LRR78_10220 [Microcystis aeruginosa FACHB-905 = DIANCHI905]WKX62067.1 hypothetical protein Q3H53_002048 [Microcystis aeruginosa PCC 7806]